MKMKILQIVASFMLLALLFAVPVFASSNDGYYSSVSIMNDPERVFCYGDANTGSYSYEHTTETIYTYDWRDNGTPFNDISFMFPLSVVNSINNGTSLSVEWDFKGYCNQKPNSFSLILFDTTTDIYSDYVLITSTDFTYGNNWYTFKGDIAFTVHEDFTPNYIGLRFNYTNASWTILQIQCLIGGASNFSYSFGNPNSPQAPSYEKPNNDILKQEEQLNEELKDATAGGLEDASNLFGGLGSALISVKDGLSFCTGVINRLLVRVPILNTITTISLIVGVFMFLVGSVELFGKVRVESGKHDKHPRIKQGKHDK